MKVLVTGASGLLGRSLVKELLSKNHKVIALYNHNTIPIEHDNLIKIKLDITDKVLIEDLILKTRPEVIIHAAAYTDVDGCEQHKDWAWKVNVEATRSIVHATRVTRSYLIYVSTDYVFDGLKGLYREDDIPNPINYYGLTKLVSEELVKNSDLLYVIVRPSAIYGFGGSKKSFAEYIIEKLTRREKIYAVADQYVSPTYNVLLAKTIVEIAEAKPMGVLHVAGERMSRYDFALRIAETLDLPVELIEKTSIKEFKHWIARRPRDSSLDTSKAKRLVETRFYDTGYALELFRQEWLKNKYR